MAVCRVCSSHCSSGVLLSEIWSVDTETLTYRDAFNSCTSLGASPHDELPQSLCLTCSLDLQGAYEFISKARRTDDLLRGVQPKREEVWQPGEDPLQGDWDDDFSVTATEDVESGWNVDAAKGSSSDEDDDKPLKYLLASGNGIPSNESQEVHKESFQEQPRPLNETILPQGEQIFPTGQYRCDTCDKYYFTLAGLNAHNEIHLPKGAASKKKRLLRPRKKAGKPEETGEKDSEALEKEGEDDAESSQLAEKPSKRQQKKPPKPKKLFPCPVCGKHMISASKLRYHMVMHTGEKDYLCTTCPKAYSTIYALKHHIRTHTGERPYECKFCGDKFLRPTTLKSHMRRHTGERPYGCSVCGKRFIQHSSMTTHMKLNHMAKTIQCPHCDKKYARQTDLNTHLLSHTGNKPFSCTLCPSRFIRQANLNKHMNQQHLSPKAGATKGRKGKVSLEADGSEGAGPAVMDCDGDRQTTMIVESEREQDSLHFSEAFACM